MAASIVCGGCSLHKQGIFIFSSRLYLFLRPLWTREVVFHCVWKALRTLAILNYNFLCWEDCLHSQYRFFALLWPFLSTWCLSEPHYTVWLERIGSHCVYHAEPRKAYYFLYLGTQYLFHFILMQKKRELATCCTLCNSLFAVLSLISQDRGWFLSSLPSAWQCCQFQSFKNHESGLMREAEEP